MPTFPLPDWTPAPIDIRIGADVVADEFGLPRRLMRALCIAESGKDLQSFDRWHRWTSEAMVYISRQDRAGLQAVLDACAAVPTNDISFGPCHQAWRWSPEYNGNPYDLDAIMAFRKLYIQDHGHALRVAAGQLRWDKYGPDELETLCRYNKPAVRGIDNPNRANYQRALDLAGPPTTTPVQPPAASGIAYEDYRDPSPAGTFAAMPLGVILHGSRSGRAGNPKASEYLGTARWEVSNPDDLGWHATIGEGVVAVHLAPNEWGWHARTASTRYLGVELAQATVDEPITDGQVAAFADWLKTRILPAWPGLPMHFPTHAEVEASGETGKRDGKTDAFPAGDKRADELRGRIMAALGAVQPAPQPSQPDQSIRALLDQLEVSRASLDDYGPPPADPAIGASADALWAYIRNMQTWRDAVRAHTDRAYAEIGQIGAELRKHQED